MLVPLSVVSGVNGDVDRALLAVFMACRSPLRIIRDAKLRAEEHHLRDATLALHL